MYDIIRKFEEKIAEIEAKRYTRQKVLHETAEIGIQDFSETTDIETTASESRSTQRRRFSPSAQSNTNTAHAQETEQPQHQECNPKKEPLGTETDAGSQRFTMNHPLAVYEPMATTSAEASLKGDSMKADLPQVPKTARHHGEHRHEHHEHHKSSTFSSGAVAAAVAEAASADNISADVASTTATTTTRTSPRITATPATTSVTTTTTTTAASSTDNEEGHLRHHRSKRKSCMNVSGEVSASPTPRSTSRPASVEIDPKTISHSASSSDLVVGKPTGCLTGTVPCDVRMSVLESKPEMERRPALRSKSEKDVHPKLTSRGALQTEVTVAGITPRRKSADMTKAVSVASFTSRTSRTDLSATSAEIKWSITTEPESNTTQTFKRHIKGFFDFLSLPVLQYVRGM